VDLLHLTGHGACNLPEPSVNALAERLRRGQFLWIDAAGTQPAFIAAADNLFNSLAAALGGNITVMDESHSLISAPFAGVGPLRDVRVNSWADAALRKTNWPYLKTLTINDRTVAVFAPYDVTAAVTSHYVYGAGGYARQDAERLLTRIVLWRFEQLHPQ